MKFSTSGAVLEVLLLSWIHQLPIEVTDLILRQIFKIHVPMVNNMGIIAMVKNVWRCPQNFVLEDVENRNRWQQIARIPSLHAYTRNVCIWQPCYYDIALLEKGIVGLSEWSLYGYVGHCICNYQYYLKKDIDRRCAEWIGFRQWMHTHPVNQKYRPPCRGFPAGVMVKKSFNTLTRHWFKYELALAYPTLYGKGGWAKRKK